MNTTQKRLVLLGALAGCAAWLGACQGQPSAGCPVLTSNPAVGLPPYWMKYSKVSGGTCGDLDGEAIGFQKYNTPGTKEIRMAYVFEGLGHEYHSNGRLDPADPEGKNLLGFSKFPFLPEADLTCSASEFTAAKQDFEEVPGEDLPDGGTGPVTPALSRKYEFTSLKFLATVNAPGTVFAAEVKLTEDTCTATLKAQGLWPQIPCDPSLNDTARNGYNLDCDPKPDIDAGHIIGSGINPTFAPEGKPVTCGPAGYCEIQLTFDEVSKL